MSLLGGPAALERRAVRNDVDGFVTKFSQVPRVGVGSSEAAFHQAGELLLVAPRGELGPCAVMRSEKVWVIRVENEDPHGL